MKLVLSLLLVVAATGMSARVESPEQAADLVVSELLGGDCVGRIVQYIPEALPAGHGIDGWHDTIDMPFDGYFVLVDDMALANWEHPCRWVFVNPEGRMEIVDMLTPPMALDRMIIEFSDLPVPDEEEPMDLLEWFTPNPRYTDDPAHTYAWIISGGANQSNNHIRYYGDVQFLYMTLVYDYGYTNDHIVICFADGLNPAPDQSGGLNSNPDLDLDGDTDFDYDATTAGITSGWTDIKAMVGPDDHLLIFTTDHGGSGKLMGYDLPPEATLNLWGSTWNDDTYDAWIDESDAASMHVVMEQCFSGGFLLETVPTTGGQPRTFASAANGYESSWAGATYPQYDEWCYWWTGAMHGSVPPAGSYPGGALPGDPDLNSDGYVSYGEAFDRSLAWDSYAVSGQEHPQYDDDPTSCGDLYYLGGVIPTSVVEDGIVLPASGNLAIASNPFSGAAVFSFDLAVQAPVDLAVMDLAGRRVATLAGGVMAGGQHSVPWDAEVPSGVYIVRFTTQDLVETLRVVKF